MDEKDLINHNVDFAFETTLASKSYASFIQDAQSNGYFVTLLFFWLNSPELAIERVKTRVNSGSHDIPEDVITRRYWAGIRNLSKLYVPLSDYWLIIDNSEPPFQVIAEGFKKDVSEIRNQFVYDQIIRQ